MSNFDGVLNPAAGWPDIPQASTSMVVLGGAGGPLNEQAKQLTARTKKLKEDIENISPVGFGGQYRNLVVTVSGVGYQGTVTADCIVVEGDDFSSKLIRGVNLSFNGANSGQNGLDNGAMTAGNWYYIHVIHNPTTDTTASLISLSATTPTLPDGYTRSCRVGAAYVAALATAFVAQKQQGPVVTFVNSTNNKTALWAIIPGQPLSAPHLINCSLMFPQTAVSTEIVMTTDSNSWSSLHSSSSTALTSRIMFVLGGYLASTTANISVVGNPDLFYHVVAGELFTVSYLGSYGYTDSI